MKNEDQFGEVAMTVPAQYRSPMAPEQEPLAVTKLSEFASSLPATFLSAGLTTMNAAQDLPITAPISVRASRRRRRKKASVAAPMSDDYRDCLEQAEVCREQARVAASLKRYAAARGLFATAVSLCQRALGLRAGAADEAGEYLRQLTMEMSTYSELAKSMERPLHSSSMSPSSSRPARSN